MAKIGLRYPAIAKITGYDENGMPVYGSGIFVGKGVKADISFEASNAELYGDDGLAEYDNTVTGYSGTLETDGFGTHQSAAKETDLSVRAYMSGAILEKGEGADAEYTEAIETDGSPAPYHGFTYIKRKIREGVAYWVVKHCYKVCFAVPDDSSQTKEKNTSFGTSSVSFTGMGLQVPGKEDMVFTKDYMCDTLDKAVALLKKLMKISDGEDNA